VITVPKRFGQTDRLTTYGRITALSVASRGKILPTSRLFVKIPRVFTELREKHDTHVSAAGEHPYTAITIPPPGNTSQQYQELELTSRR